MVNGYIVVNDADSKMYSALILCENKNQKRVLKILKQPPEQFKNRYIACVPVEPEVVREITPPSVTISSEAPAETPT